MLRLDSERSMVRTGARVDDRGGRGGGGGNDGDDDDTPGEGDFGAAISIYARRYYMDICV